MASTFLGLNTAVQGLMAAQVGVDTAGNNIDNASTPGYSLEVVNQVTSPWLDVSTPTGAMAQIGTGTQVESITRVRDSFLDSEYRDQNQALGQAQVQQNTLNQISGIINEPSTTGISNALQNFYSSWDNLESNPSDLSALTEVQQNGVTLTQTLNQTSTQLTQLSGDVQNSLTTYVTQANSLVSQVAGLTQEINLQQATGSSPNNLLDQRDELLDQLSLMGNVSVTQSTSTPAKPASVTLGDIKNGGGQVGGGVPGTTEIVVNGTTFDLSGVTLAGSGASTDVSALNNVTSSGGVTLGSLVNITENSAGQLAFTTKSVGSGSTISFAGTGYSAGDAVLGTSASQVGASGSDSYVQTSGLQGSTALGATTTINPGDSFSVSIGGGAAVNVALNSGSSALNNTPNQVVSTVNSALQAAGLSGQVTATLSNGGQIQLLSPSGENLLVQNTSGTPLTALGFTSQDQTNIQSLQVPTGNSLASGSSYQVALGGLVVVSNGQAATLSTAGSGAGSTVQATHFDSTSGTFQAATATPLDTMQPGGELQGTIDSLGYLATYTGDLDNIAQTLASGAMTVTLPGSWSLNGSSATFPVGGTLPDGTSFSAGDSLSSYAADGVTQSTDSSGNTTYSVPAGTQVTVNGINGLQALGYAQNGQPAGQPAFFVSSVNGDAITAANISVGVTPQEIASGTTTNSGDGTLAAAISGTQNVTTTFPNPVDPSSTMNGTLDDYLQSAVGELGIQGQTANNNVTNQTALVQQLSTQRQSVSGVSIDEETANVLEDQQAYSASAELIQTINSMFQSLFAAVSAT